MIGGRASNGAPIRLARCAPQSLRRVAISTIAAGLAWRSSFGCSCSLASAEEMFKDADAVVEGRAADVSRGYLRLAWCSVKAFVHGLPESGDAAEAECGVRVEFAVSRRWKGTTADMMIIMTGRGGGDCGVPFEEGSSYLLYLAQVEPNVFATNICMRPQRLEQAADDREILAHLTGRSVAP